MSGWNQVETFDIDDGQLDGLSPQQCFVLGYELAQVDSLLKGRRAIDRPVHSLNRERIEERCRRSGRDWKLDWMSDDGSESWLNLVVGR